MHKFRQIVNNINIKIKDIAKKEGIGLSKKSIYFKVDKLNNDDNVKQIKEGVEHLDGIISVSVNKKDSKISVDYDDMGTNLSEIANTLIDMGYSITVDNNKLCDD